MNTGIRFVEGRFAVDGVFTPQVLLKAKRMTKVNLDVHRFVKVENSIQTKTNYQHVSKYIDDMVFTIEGIHLVKKQVDSGHIYYKSAMMRLKSRQQSIVFAIFIKAFRCRPPYEINLLNGKLERLKELGVYPLNRKIGGFGSRKTRFIFTNCIVPILNQKALFYLILRFNRRWIVTN